MKPFDYRDVFPGSIIVPQTFGGNWNPHVHALITDTCWDREGNCYLMSEIDTVDIQGIEKLFASLVFRMLLEEGMISEDLIGNMRSWKHSGFNGGRIFILLLRGTSMFPIPLNGSKKVWEVDTLKCPKCGGQMKVISLRGPSVSFIEQSFVIRRILKHLDLWEDPRPPTEPLELVC